MRISDWSSDVCSSDLRPRDARGRRGGAPNGLDQRPRDLVQASCTRFIVDRRGQREDFVDRRCTAQRDLFCFARTQSEDRKSVVSGKRVSGRVDIGGRRVIKKNTNSRERSTTTL